MNFGHVIFSAALAGIVLLVVMLIKIEVAYYWHCKILNAIYVYTRQKFDNHEYETAEDVEADAKMYDELEEFNETVMRLHDWGYKRIAPPETLEKIRPYIK